MSFAVSQIEVVSPEDRAEFARGPWDRSAHAELLNRQPFADQVEVGSPPRPSQPVDRLRVLAWNVERGGRPEAVADLLRRAGADLALLSELDVGMARTGQRRSHCEIARSWASGYAFGVEFLELGLGNADERSRHDGEANEIGYHGNAILSGHPLEEPELVRLENRGDWYGAERGEVRIGGRMAILASLPLSGLDVVFASVHLDSHAGPDDRASELQVLLEAIETRAKGGPVLIGGDLNTTSLAAAESTDAKDLRRALAEDPQRFAVPYDHEPLFAVAAKAGYAWTTSNRADVGTHRAAETNQRSALHLDWFLARGLICESPEVIEAVDPGTGLPLSDHEAIAVTIRPAGASWHGG